MLKSTWRTSAAPDHDYIIHQVRTSALPRTVACRKRHGIALICRNDVPVRCRVCSHIGAEVLEEGVWYAAEEVDTNVVARLKELLRAQEVTLRDTEGDEN